MKVCSTHLAQHLTAFAIGLLLLARGAWGAQQPQTDIGKRLDAAATVLNEIMETPEKSIPKAVLTESKCIVVVPAVFNVAFAIGGRRGKGVASCHTEKGWSAPAPLSFRGGSLGLQIGGQSVDLVMLIMNRSVLDRLLSGKVKIGTNVSGNPGPVGTESSGETEWKNSEVLSYSRSHGAFAGINLKGAVFNQDKNSTISLYGKYIPFASILSGKVRVPPESHSFLATIRKYTAERTRASRGGSSSQKR
jgi:lipid-binding SYLF domain-containing protein